MSERNVISGVTATILSPFAEHWQSFTIWFVVAFVLIIGDLRFGLMASKKRGEKIRYSRAIRRTLNKMVDYICWVSIAFVLGETFGTIFGVPLLASVIMLVVCGIELSSIIDNYFEYRGIEKKFNVFHFLAKILRLPEIEESLEDKKEAKE